jgi:hypothetical protein
MIKHIAGTVGENRIIEWVEKDCTENWNILLLYGIQISFFKILRWFNPNFNSDSILFLFCGEMMDISHNGGIVLKYVVSTSKEFS